MPGIECLSDDPTDGLTYRSGRIYRVGVELEGGWRQRPSSYGELQGDGSVSINAYEARVIGEFVSEPMKPVDLAGWVLDTYPPFINGSCGLHLHMSFRTGLTYQKLMDKTYFDGLLESLQQWGESKQFPRDHRLFSRLKGENHFCMPEYRPDAQARTAYKEHCRYSAVNYCHRLHRTVEVRVLPMFETKELAVEGLTTVMLFTNNFLDRLGSEPELNKKIEDEDGTELILREEIF